VLCRWLAVLRQRLLELLLDAEGIGGARARIPAGLGRMVRLPMMSSRNRQKRSEARQVEKRLARKPTPSKKSRPASFAPANVRKLAGEAVEPEGKARE
jgi:hypothetical protein